MHSDRNESTGAWWIPPTCASLAVAGVMLSIDVELMVELVHPEERRTLDWFVAFGALCAVVVGVTSTSFAAHRASLPGAVLAIATPWIGALALAHVLVERLGRIAGTGDMDRSFEALVLARPAIALHTLGAATSAGLALGAFVAFFLHPATSTARALSAPLLVTAVGAALTATQGVLLEQSVVALCGDGVWASVDGLLAPASAAWLERLLFVERAFRWTLVGGVGVAMPVLAILARRSSVRVSLVHALAIVGLLATPTVSYVADARLADRMDRWAHPEWLRFDELEAPSLSELASSMNAFDAPRAIEPAGIVWNERWVGVDGVGRSGSLAAHLRRAADVAEQRARLGVDFESMRREADPVPTDRAVFLAVDARVGAERWREIVDALREADVDTLCIASRFEGDGASTSSHSRRGHGWIDAFTPTPADSACLDTETVLPSSWAEEPELLELRLDDRPHVAVRARSGEPESGHPCDEPRPIAVLTFGDGMTTASLSGLTFELLRCVRPILAWTPFSESTFETTARDGSR